MISFEDDRRTRAEQHVISALLKSAPMIRHCAQLTPRDFSHELHGNVFRAIVNLTGRDERVDALTVSYELTRMLTRTYPAYRNRMMRGRDAMQGYLVVLEGMRVVPANVGYYAAVMLEGVKP